MFDVAWSELALIGAVALVVIGPKDLPKVMRSMGQWARKARLLAGEFQRGVDEIVRQAELDDLRKQVESLKPSVENAGRAMEEAGRKIEASVTGVETAPGSVTEEPVSPAEPVVPTTAPEGTDAPVTEILPEPGGDFVPPPEAELPAPFPDKEPAPLSAPKEAGR